MGKFSHLNNPNNYITKSRISILVIWCSVSPVTGESDSLPELRSPVRTHFFSLNHCIWYSSATTTHSDLAKLSSASPQLSIVPRDCCAQFFVTVISVRLVCATGSNAGFYQSWGGKEMFKLGAEERNCNTKAPGFAVRSTSTASNSPVSPPVPFG